MPDRPRNSAHATVAPIYVFFCSKGGVSAGQSLDLRRRVSEMLAVIIMDGRAIFTDGHRALYVHIHTDSSLGPTESPYLRAMSVGLTNNIDRSS